MKSRVRPNQITAPLGVLLVVRLPEAQAVQAALALPTVGIIRRARLAEYRARARGAVLLALGRRLACLMAERMGAERTMT